MDSNREDENVCLVYFYFILLLGLDQMEITLCNLRVYHWVENALFKLTKDGILAPYCFN